MVCFHFAACLCWYRHIHTIMQHPYEYCTFTLIHVENAYGLICHRLQMRHTSIPIATAVLENTSAECLWQGILGMHPVEFWSPLQCNEDLGPR